MINPYGCIKYNIEILLGSSHTDKNFQHNRYGGNVSYNCKLLITSKLSTFFFSTALIIHVYSVCTLCLTQSQVAGISLHLPTTRNPDSGFRITEQPMMMYEAADGVMWLTVHCDGPTMAPFGVSLGVFCLKIILKLGCL